MNGSGFRAQNQSSQIFPFIQNFLQRNHRGRSHGLAGGLHRGLLLRWRGRARGGNNGRQYALEASGVFPYLSFKSLSVSTVPVPLEAATFPVVGWGPAGGGPGMSGPARREPLSLEAYSCPGNRGQYRMSLCSSDCSDCSDCDDCEC